MDMYASMCVYMYVYMCMCVCVNTLTNVEYADTPKYTNSNIHLYIHNVHTYDARVARQRIEDKHLQNVCVCV